MAHGLRPVRRHPRGRRAFLPRLRHSGAGGIGASARTQARNGALRRPRRLDGAGRCTGSRADTAVARSLLRGDGGRDRARRRNGREVRGGRGDGRVRGAGGPGGPRRARAARGARDAAPARRAVRRPACVADRGQYRRRGCRPPPRRKFVRDRRRRERRCPSRAGRGTGRDPRRRAHGARGARRVRVRRAGRHRGKGEGGRDHLLSARPRAVADASAWSRRVATRFRRT